MNNKDFGLKNQTEINCIKLGKFRCLCMNNFIASQYLYTEHLKAVKSFIDKWTKSQYCTIEIDSSQRH